MDRTIKLKLVAASALLLALAATAQVSGANAASIARVVLVACTCGAAAVWWKRSGARAVRSATQRPRLTVAARAGLSPRCGVALLEADGRSYLVAYGDGFAQLLESKREAGGES